MSPRIDPHTGHLVDTDWERREAEIDRVLEREDRVADMTPATACGFCNDRPDQLVNASAQWTGGPPAPVECPRCGRSSSSCPPQAPDASCGDRGSAERAPAVAGNQGKGGDSTGKVAAELHDHVNGASRVLTAPMVGAPDAASKGDDSYRRPVTDPASVVTSFAAAPSDRGEASGPAHPLPLVGPASSTPDAAVPPAASGCSPFDREAAA